jgi:hypothetical protein
VPKVQLDLRVLLVVAAGVVVPRAHKAHKGHRAHKVPKDLLDYRVL